MVFTQFVSTATIRRTQEFGAVYVPKPPDDRQLELLVDAALAEQGRAPRRVVAAVRVRMSESSLSPREASCLELATIGLRTEQIAERLGLRATTIRSHIESIRRKTSAKSLRTLADQIWREAQIPS